MILKRRQNICCSSCNKKEKKKQNKSKPTVGFFLLLISCKTLSDVSNPSLFDVSTFRPLMVDMKILCTKNQKSKITVYGYTAKITQY